MVERAAGMPSTLSVILPNYNDAPYLPRALDSLLAQERAADEILVIDDGSTDESRDIVARYAAAHPSVRLLIHDRNQGVIAALSRGLSEARGEFIHFGAADDFVLPGFFSTAISMLEVHPAAGLFFGDAVLVDGCSGKFLGFRPPVRPRYRRGFVRPAEIASLLRRNDNFVVTGAAVFRRQAVERAEGFDENLATFADGYLVRRVAFTSGLCYAPQAVMAWCVFPDSVSRIVATNVDKALPLLDRIVAKMASDSAFPFWYTRVFTRRWRFASARLAVTEGPLDFKLLMNMGGQRALDRGVLGFAVKMLSGRLARLTILGWLWLRLTPYSLADLVATWIVRSCDGSRRRAETRAGSGAT